MTASTNVPRQEHSDPASFDSSGRASRGDLEYHLELDRGAERKACDPIHEAARVLFLPEDVLQQLRSGVGNFRLFADVSRSGYRHAEPDDPRRFVERSQMPPSDSENVERRHVSRLASRFHIEPCPDAPDLLMFLEFATTL